MVSCDPWSFRQTSAPEDIAAPR